MMTLSQVRSLLIEREFHPSRPLGQNFLIDRNILDILVGAADIAPHDEVLEIGPGLGAVTEELVATAKRVVAVEKDSRLYDYLFDRFQREKKLELIHADALELDMAAILDTGITRVVSNLPYSVGSRILVNLVMSPSRPHRMVVTVQDEVAHRLAAGPRTPDYGKLSVWVQLDYRVELVRSISRTCFWPVPEVTSQIVSLIRRDWEPLSTEERDLFYLVTNQAFTYRRKQLTSIFAHAKEGLVMSPDVTVSILDSLGLDPCARAEALSVEDWCGFVGLLSKAKQ